MFLVRKAKKSDMSAIHEMMDLLFPNSRQHFLPYDSFLVAEREGLPIGFCHYRMRGKTAYIAGLGVLHQYREHGAGSQLMAEALFRIDRKGADTAVLKVRALNSAAKLYLNFGFFEKRWGETMVLVRKRPS
ncbi:TPA: GNAT family N-acetyltransferase [Candidatus Micrarchaeota archaeon]|nr:GNAT family N-acetyltransferase [Candidatus Micrarchaeota archaeon]HIH30140.1 GNAT family N-acetyltransferase [Candidatus Micrarchaeota archaeon]